MQFVVFHSGVSAVGCIGYAHSLNASAGVSLDVGSVRPHAVTPVIFSSVIIDNRSIIDDGRVARTIHIISSDIGIAHIPAWHKRPIGRRKQIDRQPDIVAHSRHQGRPSIHIAT